MLTLLALILITNIVIIVMHEAAHAGAMRMFGFPIQELSTGVGPVIAQRGVLSLRAFPIGGFVRFDIAKFAELPMWKRFSVYLAGPAANIAIGCVFLFLFANLYVGLPAHQSIEMARIAVVDGASNTIAATRNITESQGIIGIMAGIYQETVANPYYLVPILGIFSIGVGMFQLLPLPVFDGGKVAMEVLGVLHPFFKSTKFVTTSHYCSFVLIIALIYSTTYYDVFRIVQKMM